MKRWSLAGVFASTLIVGSPAWAQPAGAPSAPLSEAWGGDSPVPDEEDPLPRLVGAVTLGAGLRLVRDRDFLQDWVAPAFVDVWGGYVFAGSSAWRHGVALGVSANLSADGGVGQQGVSVGEQYVVGPAYLGYLALSDDLLVTTKLSMLLALQPELVPGAEVAGGATYRVTAGLGLHGELGISAFWGSADRLHPVMSLEVGVLVDYEILP